MVKRARSRERRNVEEKQIISSIVGRHRSRAPRVSISRRMAGGFGKAIRMDEACVALVIMMNLWPFIRRNRTCLLQNSRLLFSCFYASDLERKIPVQTTISQLPASPLA